MDLTFYEKTLGATNTSEHYLKNSYHSVNELFERTPSYRKIIIEDVETDVILNRTKKSDEIKILLRPSSEVNKGLYGIVDDDTYMVTEYTAHPIYPKAKLKLCNSALSWKDELGSLLKHACIVSGNNYEDDEGRVIVSSNSELVVLVQYNDETSGIKPKQRFMFSGTVYEVDSIDSISDVYKGVGIIRLGINFVSTSSSDDVDDNVADDTGNSGWGEW